MVPLRPLVLTLGLTALAAPSHCFVQGPAVARVGRVYGVGMTAKAKKAGGKKGGKGGGADDGDDEVKLAKQDTDVKGTDTKSIMKMAKEKMEKSVENTKAALGAIRTGRPSPNILDKIMVSYYGAETPLPQIASVMVQGASQIAVDPYEKNMLKEIEKAIQSSDLGMTPNNDGNMIRLNVPPLTTETRTKYVKQAKQVAEDGKVAVRNIRRGGVDAVKKLEKDNTIGEDESKGVQDDIQKETDKAVKDIDELCAAKEKELNTV